MCSFEKSVTVEAPRGRITVTALVDPEVPRCFISGNLFEKLGFPNPSFFSAGYKTSKFFGRRFGINRYNEIVVSLVFSVGGKKFREDFIVVNDLSRDMVLGDASGERLRVIPLGGSAAFQL